MLSRGVGCVDAETGDQPEQGERGRRLVALRPIQIGQDLQRLGGPEHTVPEVLPVVLHRRRTEQGVAHGFDAAPVPRQLVLVLLQPQRRGRGHLRCGRRGALAVQPDGLWAAEPWPGNVRGVGGDGRVHGRVRPETALHHRVEVGVGCPVGHDSANRDDPVVAGWIHDRPWRGDAEMVAGRCADADALLVGAVNGLSPDPRRQAAHAQGEHVAPLLDRVVQRLGERAGPEQNATRSATRSGTISASGAPPRYSPPWAATFPPARIPIVPVPWPELSIRRTRLSGSSALLGSWPSSTKLRSNWCAMCSGTVSCAP